MCNAILCRFDKSNATYMLVVYLLALAVLCIVFSHLLISESVYSERIPIFFIQTVYTRKRTFGQARAMMFADKKIPIL
jgi:hypothetical protein